MSRVIHIAMPIVHTDNGVSRASASVDGSDVWFESSDAALAPSPEAFAGAFLIPALHRGARLSIDAPLSPAWTTSIRILLEVLNEWWDYPVLAPTGLSAPVPALTGVERTALCFSGGVDSFHTLLRRRDPIDILAFVFGYDFPVTDVTRAEACRRSFHEIAAACSKKPVVIRTNLRQHPLFASVTWERTHGAAVAAIGHLLSAEIDRLVVSSSYPYSFPHSWGSHWRIDELWSSESLHVEHWGASRWRWQKVEEIADEPLVHEHLRVCWANRAPIGNCFECERCVRTMLTLCKRGQLQHCRTLDGTRLIQALDALPPPDRWMLLTYVDALESGALPSSLAAAVARLVARTRQAHHVPAWRAAARRLKRAARTLISPARA